MCGIAGIIHLHNQLAVIPSWLHSMADSLRHRGPDDEGYVYFEKENFQCFGGKDTPDSVNSYQLSVKNNWKPADYELRASAAFAHRRLSIVDISELGHQPLSDPSHRYWITYNGEIYNYQEIRLELIVLGHTFYSKTDTEVILHAYLQWGSECVHRFNGMWAFAIYDRQECSLFCSRDRFGVKPFYYVQNGDFFAFASEQKALITLSFLSKKLNEKAVYDYLVLGTTESESESFFENIIELKAGHQLYLKNQNLRIEKYYSLAFNTDFGTFDSLRASNYADKTFELLQEAVRLRLRSDVTVGACLSGGIDSSALVSLASKLRTETHPLHVFTAVYPGLEVDESGWAKKVVDDTGANWHTIETKPDDLLSQYEDVIYSQDIPFFGSSTLSQYKVMELIAKNGIKVTLDGQGADELFSGYPNHFFTSFFHDLIHFESGNLSKMERAGENAQHDFIRFLAKRAIAELPFGLGYKYLKTTKYDFQLLRNDFWNAHQERYYEQRRPSISNLNKVLDHEYAGPQLNYLMRTADRNSMRHSVESRVPFADDHHLAEYVFSLPAAYKLHQGQSKYLLRESMKGKMTEAVRQRWDKKGFATPEYLWFKNKKNELKELVTDNLEPFVDVKQLHKNWDSIFSNQIAGNTLGISRFLILSMWRKRFGV